MPTKFKILDQTSGIYLSQIAYNRRNKEIFLFNLERDALEFDKPEAERIMRDITKPVYVMEEVIKDDPAISLLTNRETKLEEALREIMRRAWRTSSSKVSCQIHAMCREALEIK